ncbi:MAG: putative signal transducing protein [Sphingobacteriaceae bacterium]
MANQQEIKLVEVFAGELWQATMIQHVLEDNGVDVHLENALMGTIEPQMISAGGLNPIKIIVSDANYDLARKLIDEFNQSDPMEAED